MSSNYKLRPLYEDSLPEDAWKDSFDKLVESRTPLRERNLLKENVRASFNINSSVENSSWADSNGQLSTESSKSSGPSLPFEGRLARFVSTPLRNRLSFNPFKCTLSPVGTLEFAYFKGRKICRPNHVEETKLSTSNNSEVIVVGPPVNVDPKPSTNRRSMDSSPTKKQVCFQININDATAQSLEEVQEIGKKSTNGNNLERPIGSLPLQPGKWRKSLSVWRQSHQQPRETNRLPRGSNVLVGLPSADCTNIGTSRFAGQRKSMVLDSKRSSKSARSTRSSDKNSFKRQVLQRCGQRRPLEFGRVYDEHFARDCCKIGEGAFGEVFMRSAGNGESVPDTVLKIIPIEGEEKVNGEFQKTFEQILSEIIISMELSALSDKNRKSDVTAGFVNVKKVNYIRGRYPAHFVKLWEEYDERTGSENDPPSDFKNTQQYIALELSFSGQDLEKFVFDDAKQSYYALQQIVLTLMVAENCFEFEHRDLHWGNVLVLKTDEKCISYKVGEKEVTLPSNGVKITIIDYTLSRMTYDNCCFYNDLSNDEELFAATGDYQFEIYRMMRDALDNKWEQFEPRTNVFWITYIIDKMINEVSYAYSRSKAHTSFMKKMKDLSEVVLDFKSAKDLGMYMKLVT